MDAERYPMQGPEVRMGFKGKKTDKDNAGGKQKPVKRGEEDHARLGGRGQMTQSTEDHVKDLTFYPKSNGLSVRL